MHRYWKASNYLAVGQIYLLDKNPLLRKPLTLSHVKTKLLGHFGTTPGQVRTFCAVTFIIDELFPLLRLQLARLIFMHCPDSHSHF
jgi:phosphoketolase